MECSFIFVYGTLRRSSGTRMSHILLRYSEYVSEATLQGVLYEVDGYPGAIESSDPEDRVYGELYKIMDENSLLPLLDEYEQCTEHFPLPHEYVRKVLSITLFGGRSVMAWVYVYNHDVTGLARINRHFQ